MWELGHRQKEEMSVIQHAAQTRLCFQKKEDKNSTEAKDNERSLCVKHQQVHIDFSSPSVSVI